MKRIHSAVFWVDGFENWIQTEVVIAGRKAGYCITTMRKKKHDSDVVIVSYKFERGIELKHWRNNMEDTLTHAFSEHPGADYYLFLHQLPCEYFEKAKTMVSKYKTLHIWHDWHISLMTKRDKFERIPD